MAKSRLHELSEHGQSVWIDSLSREMLETGELARLMDGGRRRRRHVQPDHLPEGAVLGRLVRRAADRGARRGGRPIKEIFLHLAERDIQDACDLMRPVWDEGQGQDGYVSLEVDPTLAYDREAADRGGDALPRVGRPPQPVRQDPGDAAGARRDRGLHREGQGDQRHADLLARALRGGRRGLHQGARAARRSGRRPTRVASGRELLRLARRYRGRQAARGDRRPGHSRCRASSRSRTPSSRTGTAADLRGRPLGRPRRGRVRPRSAACGRRRRPRTRSTAT